MTVYIPPVYDHDLLARYAEWLENTSWYAHAGERNAGDFSYMFAGLAGESGEALDAFKKVIRVSGQNDDEKFDFEWGKHIEKMAKEMSDSLWYLIKLLTASRLTIQDLALINMVKLHERYGDEGVDWPLASITYEQAQLHVEVLMCNMLDPTKGAKDEV